MKKISVFFTLFLTFTLMGQNKTNNGFEANAEILVQQLTLEEKASLCSGLDAWTFKSIDRLDIPAIWVADGPHGLRKAPTSDVGGYGDQHPATCYPTASALAATWDNDLIYRVGIYLGTECQALDVNVLLGPGVNIKRTPTGGRNFEYFSEDPVLAGNLAAAYINGVQSMGVGTSLKHYACNSQETQRMLVSSEVDERALREIYLKNFEIAVKESQPWTIMAAYNPVNGTDATANKILLHDILKEEWGFEGIVISDWMSVYDRVAGMKAGMHVEMPGSQGVNDAKIVEAVKNGTLDEAQIDKLVKEVLMVILKAKASEKEGVEFDIAAHHQFAEEVAGQAITLLKNEHSVLPLNVKKYKNIALIGEFAVKPRYQGNGSSEIKPTQLDALKPAFVESADKKMKVSYAQGYYLDNDNDFSLIAEALETARTADVAVLHVGLPQHYESEGYDRKHIDIPPSHVKLIEEVSKVQPNVVVVLTNGAAIAMPWIDKVPAVLETWLAGQAGAGAIADVLFGKVNPSGKLAETFPVRLEDTPAYFDFPGLNRKLQYGESIFAGYRWYDKRDIEPLFPFGFGLSYTSFKYDDLQLSAENLEDNERLSISFTLTNTGNVAGKEIVQLYIADEASELLRPVRELKSYDKIELQAGESKTVEWTIDKNDLCYYHDGYKIWLAESGTFEVEIGASSRDIRLSKTFNYAGNQQVAVPFDERTTLAEWFAHPETKMFACEVLEPHFQQMYGKEGQTLGVDFEITEGFFLDMPIIKFYYLSGGLISEEAILDMVAEAQKVKLKL